MINSLKVKVVTGVAVFSYLLATYVVCKEKSYKNIEIIFDNSDLKLIDSSIASKYDTIDELIKGEGYHCIIEPDDKIIKYVK